MKIYNDVGCSMDGITEEELPKFLKAGWVTEDTYKKEHPEEFE